MNLTSPSQVKAWCIENGFHPNKVLGQNFLIDRNALEAIVDVGLASVAKDSGAAILEIGPGLGVLTEEILKRGCSVTAVEKDPILAARLAESLGKSMTVLVQTEVAERLAAKEGSKTRGLAGVWAQLDYDVKIVRKVAASCFWPRPEIGSSVVTLIKHDRNVALSDRERDIFHRLTKKAFEHRRKQLGSIFKDLIQSSARAEELSNEDWINLSKGIAENEDS